MSAKRHSSDLHDLHPILDRFYHALPHIPYCGWGKAAISRQPKDYAINKDYIEASSPTHKHWIVLDIDEGDAWVWQDRGLPAPNLIVQNPDNVRCHLFYAVSPVCNTDNGRSHPIEYYKAVRDAMARQVNADLLYDGRIAKNPFSRHWRTTPVHDHEYSLGELADYVVLSTKKRGIARRDLDHLESRHWQLFHHLRFWAYMHVREFRRNSHYEHWFQTIFALARNLNYFPDLDKGPLRETSLKSTARSVARWTWDKYTGSKINKGVMALTDSDLTLDQKQCLAAKRTHTIRRASTEARIRNAIETLFNAGKRITKTAVAELVRLSRQSIYRYYKDFFEHEKDSVTFAEHKVTASAGDQWDCDKTDHNRIKAKDMEKDMEANSKYGTANAGARSALAPLPDRATVVQICQYLVNTPKIDGLQQNFSYNDRRRIATVLRKHKATIPEVLDICVDVSLRTNDHRYRHLNTEEWIGYYLGMLKRIRYKA